MRHQLCIGREPAENIFQLSRKSSLLSTSHVTREENEEGRPLTRLNQSPQRTGSWKTPLGSNVKQKYTQVLWGSQFIQLVGEAVSGGEKKLYIYIKL